MAEGLLLPSSLLPSRGALRPNTCSVAEHKRDWPRTWLICRAEEMSCSSPKAYLAEQNFVLAELNICRALEGRRHYCRTLFMAEGITAELRRLKPVIAFCRTHLFLANWARQPLLFVRLIIVWLCRTETTMPHALPNREHHLPNTRLSED